MINIGVDGMGLDAGVKEMVSGIEKYSRKNKDCYFHVAVSNEYKEHTMIKKKRFNGEFVFVENEILITDSPFAFFRKKNNSMAKIIELLKTNKVQAVVSAGNSSAYVSGATLVLKLIGKLIAPAFMPIFPTIKGGKFILLDGGAVLDVNPKILFQWGILGEIFYRSVYKFKNPKCSLLNIGNEDKKGNKKYVEANAFLHKHLKCFDGNVEARDVLSGNTQVILCDGFVGNILLKSLEGAGKNISNLLKENFRRTLWSMLAALFSFGVLRRVKKTIDYRETGGALVIGVNGIVVKAHGASDAKALGGAFGLAYDSVKSDVLKEITNEFALTPLKVDAGK